MARRPFASSDRALFWTFVIAAFAAAAVGLAARAVDRLAGAYEAQRQSYAIVRVVAPEGDAGLMAAQTALHGAPQVRSATPMDAARATALLQQWGGAPAATVDGETPAALPLIELELTPGASVRALETRLATAGVTAQVMRAPESRDAGIAGRIRALAIWCAGGFALVMALIISFAARALATRRHELVAVLADIGASKGQAASRVADEASVKGFGAGVVGALLAAVAAALALIVLAADGGAVDIIALIKPLDLVPLALTPFGAAIAAAMGARAGAESFYVQAARLA